jgi:hypothetical protein
MTDESDSGERRTQRLEIKLTAISKQLENMPNMIELAILKAIKAQKRLCDDERRAEAPATPPAPVASNIWASHAGKIIAALLTVLTGLLAASLAK